jgi:Cupin-like domain
MEETFDAGCRSRSPERIGEIPRRALLREHCRPRRPCIIAGATDRWRARAWTLDWFRSEHGAVRFPVSRAYSRALPPQVMTLREYIDAVTLGTGAGGPQALYLSGVEFLGRIPSLCDDFSFPDYTWLRSFSNTLLFIGGAGARTPLHFDFSHTVLAQLVGRKRFRLFSPDQTPLLAPLPREPFQTFSGLSIAPSGEGRSGAVAVAEAPGVRPAFDFVLQPGEMVFLPDGWWHGVESLDPSVSITRSWWDFGLFLTESPYLAFDWLRRQVRRRRSSTTGMAEPPDWLGF